MHRRQIEELKRAEKEAAERVQAASTADPSDPDTYKRALFEWQSARAALRSAGVQVKPMVPPGQPTPRRSAARKSADGNDPENESS